MRKHAIPLLMIFGFATFAQAYDGPGAIDRKELDYQIQSFKNWWDTDYVLRFDDLPEKGSVPDFRIPYSGHIYPDRGGGTKSAMAKYDRAFNGGRDLATAWEEEDVNSHIREIMEKPGFRPFGGLIARAAARRRGPPGWYGHCNGWTAAAIRHPQPEHSVTRNGVTFTPADIKAMLAEIYMYTDTEFLCGVDYSANPGSLHLVFTNWIGRGSYPIGMESTLGKEVWNYPVYAYTTTSRKLSERSVEVRMNIAYSNYTEGEFQESPRIKMNKDFHYSLRLNEDGEIVGGTFYRDSAQVDMLWAPLQAVQGGKKGNENGNPYIDVKEVLSIWRASVPEDLRKKWLNIDPTEEDRVLDESEETVEETASRE